MSSAPSRAPSPPSSLPSTPSALARLKSLLRKTVRLSTSDGRVFLGTFVGTDRALNVLLVSTTEFRPSEESSDGRFVGQIMVPWRLVTRAEVQRPWDPDSDSEQREQFLAYI